MQLCFAKITNNTHEDVGAASENKIVLIWDSVQPIMYNYLERRVDISNNFIRIKGRFFLMKITKKNVWVCINFVWMLGARAYFLSAGECVCCSACRSESITRGGWLM